MGRLVKKSEQDSRQKSLLGFFRKPLGDETNATQREPIAAPSKPIEAIDGERANDDDVLPTGPSVEAVDATTALASSEDRAGDDSTIAPNDAAPRTHASQRPPLRMADALMRIERAINSWERLFASHERARGDELATDESARAARTAECTRTLRVEAYRHRIETQRESRGAPRWTRSLRARQHGGDPGGRKRTLENAGTSLNVDRLTEVGTCTLPSNPNEGAAVSAAGDPVLSMSFDPTGAYLAAATAGGLLTVQSWDTMRRSEGLLYEPRFQRRGALGNPSIHRSLSSVAWRRGGDAVATASRDGMAVEIVDLDAGGVTARTLLAENAGSALGRTGDGHGAGLLDVLFCPGEGNRVLAAGRRGRVYLWDDRCAGGLPRAELTAPTDRHSPFNCARASDDGQTVIAGSGRGMVHVWDLRGGTGGTKARAAAFSFGSQNKTSHQLLRSVDVAELLQQVPVIRDGPSLGTGLRSAVHWCEQDPNDQRRIGFHLGRGWSGVIDVSGPRGGGGNNWTGPLVTHAHCPPSTWGVSETGSGEAVLVPGVCGNALAHTRKGAWVGSAVAVGCPGRDCLRLLDFSPAPGARHWVAGLGVDDLAREEEEEAAAAAREAEAEKRAEAEAAAEGGEDAKRAKGESGRERIRRARRGRWWNDGAIELSGPAFATVAHPSAPDMIVAGSWGAINLVGHR